jgi:Xaa-Pro aminopeptidase
VTSLVNVRYLTGFTGSAGSLLITADGAGDVLCVDGRYVEQAAAEAGDVERLEARGLTWVGERVGTRVRLGVESSHLSWDAARGLVAALPGVAVQPAAGHVEALRVTKDEVELRVITQACRIGDAAFDVVVQRMRPGMTERAVAQLLDAAMLDQGADEPGFRTIVASGPNGAYPHHRAGDRVVERGDLVTVDFGARVDGYTSDMSRTVALGQPSGELRRLYGAVARAQQAGVDAVVDGVEAGAVDAACRSVLAGAGLAEAFVHPSGHALGLEIHEEPFLREGSAARLPARATVTVEPGAYVPGLGGVRIEDVVVVLPSPEPGPSVLTTASKDLLVL